MPRKKKTKRLVNLSDTPQSFIKSSLKTMGKVYFAKGQTVQEAITNLKPEIAKGVGILILEKNGIQKMRVVQPKIINNLFGKFVSRLAKEISLKNIMFGFDKNLFEN